MNVNPSMSEMTWTARRVRPVVLLHVVAVFVGFMAAAYFVFHSPAAVKALFSAAIAGVASLVPSILSRVEYRLTETGLARRSLRGKRQAEFQDLFLWDQLSYVLPTGSGFKFYKRLDEPHPVRRFWKLHMASGCSGEVHVEPEDRPQVEGILAQRGVPIRRPQVAGQVRD